ncbi:phage repressor protein CI [Rahnella sp. PD4]|uniref:phage repressor protein CI n=1 Tax=Rahnella sp. PD4 TaxID=3368611 RepID=UPI003BA2E9A2
MIGEKMDSQEILNRLMSAYGVNSQKALAEVLAIPANNISGWIQRDRVPGNPIIKCALDTNADLHWLVTGEFANANISSFPKRKLEMSLSGKTLITTMLSNGGKTVLKRIMEAYEFSTQKELSDYLGISTGTISTWIRREYFPADVVIACALDTGVSLDWLATGSSQKANSNQLTFPENIHSIPYLSLNSGKLEEQGVCNLDRLFIPEGLNIDSIYLLNTIRTKYLVSRDFNDISNGMWLLSIDGILDIYTVSRRPRNNLKIFNQRADFECSTKDVIPEGVIIASFEINI